MKIGIFGSNGFIGKHLLSRLNNDVHKAIGISRSYLSYKPPLPDSNTVDFFKAHKFDYIYHLSAYGNKYDQTNELETFESNLVHLFKLLDSTKNIEIKGIINFSSSSVALPYETMYSATKAGGERLVKAFVNKYDKPIVNVRPFTVIGKGDNPDHLLSKLVNSCITEDQMLFVGAPVHDYISVDDFIDAVLLVAENAEKLKGQTIDIGTGVQTTNEEVFNIVRRVMNKIPRVNRVDTMRPYDTSKWVANPEVIQSLGWKQKQSIEDVVRSLIS